MGPANLFRAVSDPLWKNGYTDEDIGKALHGSLMRVYEYL